MATVLFITALPPHITRYHGRRVMPKSALANKPRCGRDGIRTEISFVMTVAMSGKSMNFCSVFLNDPICLCTVQNDLKLHARLLFEPLMTRHHEHDASLSPQTRETTNARTVRGLNDVELHTPRLKASTMTLIHGGQNGKVCNDVKLTMHTSGTSVTDVELAEKSRMTLNYGMLMLHRL